MGEGPKHGGPESEPRKAKVHSTNTAFPTCTESEAEKLASDLLGTQKYLKIDIGHGTHVEETDVNTTSGCLDNPGRVSTGKLQPP